jgi:hypothetical protein
MTDVCRFDFNSVGVAAFDRSSAAVPTGNRKRTADRDSANDWLSHDGKSFFSCSGMQMPANRPRGGQIILGAKNFSVRHRAAPGQRQRRLSKMKNAAAPSGDISLYKSVTNSSCKSRIMFGVCGLENIRPLIGSARANDRIGRAARVGQQADATMTCRSTKPAISAGV